MTKNISKQEATDLLKGNYKKAENLLSNKDDFERFLQSVERKLKHVPVVGSDLAVVPAMISLLKSYTEGKYRSIPIGSITAIISSLMYLLSPIDILPDAIPGVGLVDDALVIKVCLELVKSDLEAYDDWRRRKGLL